LTNPTTLGKKMEVKRLIKIILAICTLCGRTAKVAFELGDLNIFDNTLD